MNHLARTALAGLADLPDKERAFLLATFEAWLDNNGSAQAAADQLYVHRNIIRLRDRSSSGSAGRGLRRSVDPLRQYPASLSWNASTDCGPLIAFANACRRYPTQTRRAV